MLTTPRIPGGLTRSPIGIIALFIALIYSLATALFGVAAGHLSSSERMPLILFIVIFPVIVLGVFCYLVTRHHLKLYAPNEYPSEASFLRSLDFRGAERKLRDEISEIRTSVEAQSKGQEGIEGQISEPAPESAETSGTLPSQPPVNQVEEAQSSRSLEQFEAPRIEKLIVAATALGTRLVETETDKKFFANVKFPSDGAVWDGGVLEDERFIAIEVKLAFNNFLSLNTIRSVLERAAKTAALAKTRFGVSFDLFFVIAVTTDHPGVQARIIGKVEKVAKDFAFPVHVRSLIAPRL